MDPSSGATGPSAPPDSPDFERERRWIRRANEDADAVWEGVGAPGDAEQIDEEEHLRRAIPRVRPRTTEDLSVEPPPRTHYRTPTIAALRELWGAREVLLTFVERDLRVRYKQAVLGAFWAIVQPLMLMVIFTVVFGKIAKVGSEGLPYYVFAYSALVPWSLFTGAITYATSNIIGNSAVVRKVYMPREIFALSGVFSAAFDFVISFAILLVLLFTKGITPTREWVALVPLILVLLAFTTAASLFVTAVTVYFRDTRYGIPMLLQIALYATPVAYPLAKMTGPHGFLHGFWASAYPYLNPLSPVINGFRRVLGHGWWPQWQPFGVSAAVAFVLLAVTYVWYKRLDRTFADVI